MADHRRDATQQASVFLQTEPAIWHGWVPQDIATRIAASLQPAQEQATATRIRAAGLFPRSLVIPSASR